MNITYLLIISSVIAFSYWLEEHTSWVAHIPGILLIIILAVVLGNADLIPSSQQAYSWAFNWGVPIGISCMLLAFNPSHLLNIPKDFIICFIVGTIGTAVGGVIAGLLLQELCQNDYWRISAQLSASFIGGYENAVSVGTALKTSTPIFIQTFSGDSILTSFWIIFNIFQGRKITHIKDKGNTKDNFVDDISTQLDITSLAITITVVLFVILISNYIYKYLPVLPKIFWVSFLSTLATFLPLRHRFLGSYLLGSIILSYFIFACGAISNLEDLLKNVSMILLFPIIIVFVHAVILFTFAKKFKIKKDIAIVTSQCLIGGPATALAVVSARKWNYQFEAVALGLLGYAIGNYFGFAVAKILYVL